MLSSQITSVSHNSMSLTLRRGSFSSSTAILRSSGSLPRKSRPHNQIRTLRIGLWSSYVEPSLQKEFRRRNRAIKHKYIEAINRKLAWDRQNPGLAGQNGFKGFMCSAWHSQISKSGGQWVDDEKLGSKRHDAMKNSNSGIEDVEMGAFDKFWGKDGFYELLRRRSRAFGYDPTGLNASNDSSHTPTKESARGFSAATSSGATSSSTPNANTNLEYEIDPITNRKVFKKKPVDAKRKPIDVPVKTFKGYRSQFQDFQPPKSEPAERESNSYKPTSTSQNNAPKKYDPSRECLQDYEDTNTYKPFFAYEPNGEKPDPVQDRPEPVQDGLKDFDTKASYKWTSWLSDDKAATETPAKVCPVQEGLKDYDARTSYEASPSNTPGNKISNLPPNPDPVQQGLRDFDAIAPYGTVKSSDLDSSSTQNEVVEGGLKDFDAKTSYGPVLHNEPDGKAPSTQSTAVADNGLREFDNKADYGTRRILKNISLSRGNSMTDRSFRYQNDIDRKEDLDLLRASDVRASSGIIKGSKKESEAERLRKREELERDFEKPQPFEEMFADETTAAEKVLETPKATEQPFQATQTARKLTGNFIRDFPEEFQTSWTASKDTSGILSSKYQTDVWGYDKAPRGLELSYQQEVENDIQRAEKEYIDGRASKESFARKPETLRLQTSLDRSTSKEPEKENGHTLQAETESYSKTPQGLETSYAEECKLQAEKDPYSKKPQGLETSYKDECAAQQGEGDPSATTASSGNQKDEQGERLDGESGRQKLQLAAERLKRDYANQKKQELELVNELRTIIKEEHLGDPKQAIETLSAANNTQPAPLLNAVGFRSKNKDGQATQPVVKAQQPTAYKILAYDPTMQSISTAETTSVVTDSASALTPAEVLLRLSNPAKFFPHFQPLQEEGYEIVSGSGDVLVFRRVRTAGPPGKKSESSSSYEERTRKSTNPIDGMQPIAATGNFASPTGFVNYDRPDSSEPPFKSNIDVRREESVFSGKSSWTEKAEETQRKKPSMVKRVLLGGAMVGGCSYAIGVVTEYFKSGGIDGLGPQTF